VGSNFYEKAKKVLVVDDDESIISLIKAKLESKGLELSTANDGNSALRKIRKEHFDLVILDVKMPFFDGIEVVRQIRLDEKLRNIPIIILSGASFDANKEAVKELKINSYITKPFDSNLLISTISMPIMCIC